MSSFETTKRATQAEYKGVDRDDGGIQINKSNIPWYNTTKFVITLIIIIIILIVALIVTAVILSNESTKDINACSPSITSNQTINPSMSPTINPSKIPTTNPTMTPTDISYPKNLIIVVGDGMGQTYNTAYRTYKNLTKTLLDEYFTGRYSTNPTNIDGITDSASGATVFACGVSSQNGFIGLDGNGNPYGSILAAAKRQGKGTGIIATKSVTDATPASFSAYALTRYFNKYISEQQIKRQINDNPMIDILLGGGRKWFESWGFFDNDTVQSMYGWNTVTKDGDAFIDDISSTNPNELPYLGLFADDGYPYYLDRINGYIKKADKENNSTYPGMLNMTKKAINLLSAKYENEGFFLMVEASEIDLCGHDNDIVCMLWEMEEFTDTVDYILKYAKSNNDTLVVILSDHETGGMSIARDGSYIKDSLVNYHQGKMPRDGNISQYWGSYEYDYSISEPKSISNSTTNSALYKWFPQTIIGSKHTAQWFADQLQLAENGSIPTLNALYNALESDYLGIGPGLSNLEREFINYTYDRDYYPRLYGIAQLMSARTLTGWSTHQHSGCDVAIHSFGPNSDMFYGHYTNYEVGQMLSKAFGVETQQLIETNYLQTEFINGNLKICDEYDKLSSDRLFIEWNNSVDYPVGNLLYPQKCVQKWL